MRNGPQLLDRLDARDSLLGLGEIVVDLAEVAPRF